MNSLAEVIPFLKGHAPKARNFSDLLSKLEGEAGRSSPICKLFRGAHDRYAQGKNGPRELWSIFDEIGSGLKVVKATPASKKAEETNEDEDPKKKPATDDEDNTEKDKESEEEEEDDEEPEEKKKSSANAASLGRTLVSLATHPDPKIRKPIVDGLQQSLAASAKPDFSFLKGMERVSLSMEFERLGGLSEQSHWIYMHRRREYCETHRLTPEQVSGAKEAIIPEKITKDQMQQREQQAVARKALPALAARLHQVNLRVLGQAKANGGKVPAATIQERAAILQQVNRLEKTLGLKLTP
jgi:hypothetical protein